MKTTQSQREQAKAWRLANSDRYKFLQKEWRSKNPTYDKNRHRSSGNGHSSHRKGGNKRDHVLTSVYLVKAGAFIKIGIAENLKSRLIVIQTGCPLLVEVIYHSVPMPRPAAREIEVKCHNHIIEHHVRGEWFEAAPEQVIEFLLSLAPREKVTEQVSPQLRLIA